MKKILVILLALSLVVFGGSGGDNQDMPAAEPLPVPAETQTPTPQPEPEPTPEPVTGPTQYVFHNIKFEIPSGWVFDGNDSTGSILINDGDAMITISEPRAFISSAPDLSNMQLTMEGILLSSTLSGHFEAQNMEFFPMIDVENLRYPTLGATFLTQMFGDMMSGASFLIFGSEQFLIVHSLLFRADADFSSADLFSFVGSIEFLD